MEELFEMKRLSPQQQLWQLLNEPQRMAVRKCFMLLRLQYQEDLSLALVAYVRFGLTRPFQNPVLQELFGKLVLVINSFKHAEE